MIKTRSLRIDYEDITAVCDLNLDIRQGQIYGLVGPNGAGKTSTLKALAGIIEPTYGEIRIGPYDLELDPQKALEMIGFMPDFPPLYENLKVWEYLDAFGAAYLLSRQERHQRARFWIEKTNLQDKWDAFIHTLSRGMRQRLVLAKTLLHDPQILILDEPASGLDPIARKELQEILRFVATQGKTIIISSHILTELSEFCNALGIMEKGKMFVSGTMDEIRSRIGSKGKLLVALSVISDAVRQKLNDLLNQSNLIRGVKEISSGVWEAQFLGEANDATQLLQHLNQANLPISDFHVEKEDIEDIFFKIGAREVS